MSVGAFGAGLPATCPCGTGLAYAACCGALLTGDRAAATAEELMRSRYTAFAMGDEAYLVRTWHPRTRPAQVGLDAATRWTGLTVLRAEAGAEQDDEGVVEFAATWRHPSGATGELHEVSRFVRRAGRWLYLDGDHV